MTADESSDAYVHEDPEHARELRGRLRALLAEHLPAEWLGPFTYNPDDFELSNRFCEVLAAEGLLVPDWPVEYGGQALDLASSVTIREEMWAHFEPRGGQYYGPNWIGPSIFHYGTPEQQALHLPQIAAGRGWWCQGFSEPDAGSDLANMKTRAVPDGDGYRITGQKIWTSWALWAKWCYLLARIDDGEGTDDGNRREGITIFLIPMDREGITVRGIDGIPGPHHLCEVFLDDVWAERAEILGEPGSGWQVIRDALSNERVGIARYARDDRLIADVLAIDEYRDALPASRWMPTRVRNRMARLMTRRALWFQRDGGSHNFIVSATRMVSTRANQFIADTLSEAVGDAFFDDRYMTDPTLKGSIEFFWRYMQAATVASGTVEMLQRDLSRSLFRGERIRHTDEVEELRSTIDKLLAARGGVDATRKAIEDPSTRRALFDEVDAVVRDLDPREGEFEGLAAAEVCRGAGYAAAPIPIEAMLLRRSDGRPLGLLSPHGRIEHGDLFDAWYVVTTDGETLTLQPSTELIGSKVGPFVNRLPGELGAGADPATPIERALLHVLPSWYLLGAAEQALDLASVYATERVQFGQPIASYQGVAFPLADACSELQALYELALDSLHRVYVAPADAIVDALALRWAALDVVRRVLKIAHQILGAVGFCDEHNLAIVTLAAQARLRLPTDLEASLDQLAAAVDTWGFDSIFTPTTAAFALA